MKRNRALHRNYSHRHGGHAKGHKAYPAALLMDLKPSDLASLETQHRLSWRKYIVSLIAPLLISTASLGGAMAADESLTAAPVSSPDPGLKGSVSAPAKKPVKVSVAEVQSFAPALNTVADTGKIVNPAETKVPEEKKKDEKIIEKSLSGTIGFIRKQKMSVEFTPGEEMYLSIDKKVKLNHVKTFSELGQGDRVGVKFLQTFKEPKKEGEEPVIIRNVVTEISLIKKAKPESELSSGEIGV